MYGSLQNTTGLRNLSELIRPANDYRTYLKARGMKFDIQGRPIFTKEMFLYEPPELLIGYRNRNSHFVKNPKKTVLCFFAGDQLILPRLTKVLADIPEYKKYMAVVGPDLTVTGDMDIAWQRLIILINMLHMAVLAVNGIKIVINTRIGSNECLDMLSVLPKYTVCASGFLGYTNTLVAYDYTYLTKVLYILPSFLLIYGKVDKINNKQMDAFGIKYRYYPDYHTLCNKERRTSCPIINNTTQIQPKNI